MIDIHCHLLPAIDDGPKCINDSLAMARHAVDSKITRIVTTPHITPGKYDNNLDIIKEAYDAFLCELKTNNISIELGFAAEVRLDPLIIEMVESDTMPYLGEFEGQNLILLEFPHNHIPPGSDELIRWLDHKGIKVIIAHPERNRSLNSNIERVKSFVSNGCLLQLTAGSLTGVFSDKAKYCALELLRKGWCNVIASDAHNLNLRRPELEGGRREAEKVVGEESANKMVIDLPEQISRCKFK